MAGLYRKLTGKARQFVSYSQLWTTGDHLLLVRSNRFKEQYSRFRFEDIESIVVTALDPEPVRQIAFGLLSIAAFAAAWLIPDSRWAKGFFAVPTAIAVIYSIADVLRGGKCRCLLRTAVSEQLLTPLSRLSRAQKVLAELAPLIQAAQGALSPVTEEVAADHALADSLTERPANPLLANLLLGVMALSIATTMAVAKWSSTQLATIEFYLFSAEWIFAILLYMRRPRFGLAQQFYSTWLPVIFVMLGAETLLVMGYFGYYVSQLADNVNPRILAESLHSWPYFWETTIFSIAWRMAASVAIFVNTRSEA